MYTVYNKLILLLISSWDCTDLKRSHFRGTLILHTYVICNTGICIVELVSFAQVKVHTCLYAQVSKTVLNSNQWIELMD